MRKTKILKISQDERDQMVLDLNSDDYVNNNCLVKQNQLISFEYSYQGVNIRGTGTVIGFRGKGYCRKVMLATQQKDMILLPINSRQIQYKIIKGTRKILSRAKLYYFLNKK